MILPKKLLDKSYNKKIKRISTIDEKIPEQIFVYLLEELLKDKNFIKIIKINNI